MRLWRGAAGVRRRWRLCEKREIDGVRESFEERESWELGEMLGRRYLRLTLSDCLETKAVVADEAVAAIMLLCSGEKWEGRKE